MDREAWRNTVHGITMSDTNEQLSFFFHFWTSLVVQWIRICLPMQGTGSIPGPEDFHMPWSN